MKNNKLHTTNYYNTFIEVSEDCPATCGEIPPFNQKTKSVARHQFEILKQNPYKFTSDEILTKTKGMRSKKTK